MLPLSDFDPPGRRAALVNGVLILVNIAVFAVQWFLDQQGLRGAAADPCLRLMAQAGLGLTEGDQFLCAFAVIPREIVHGQDLFTLVTASFLHGGLLHLGSNMLYLWIFGDNIERAIGSALYPVFYVLAGIVAFVGQAFISAGSGVPNIGASGAVAGVLGAYVALYPLKPIRTLILLGCFPLIVRVAALILIGWWAVIQFASGLAMLSRVGGGGIAYWAHIVGFVFGLVVGLGLRAAGALAEGVEVGPS